MGMLQSWAKLSVAWKALVLVAAVVGVAVVAWLISPLFYNVMVNESLPGQPAAMAAQPADAMAKPTDAAMAAQPADAMAKPTVVVQTDPIALQSGSFTHIDKLHYADGKATIYRTTEGKLVLRLEDFVAGNGPDLYVALSGHPMPRSNDETHASGYREIARLKGNQGNQNYELPSDLDLSQYHSVVIWCRAFSVVFSSAELQ
jgi:hypothetical protein